MIPALVLALALAASPVPRHTRPVITLTAACAGAFQPDYAPGSPFVIAVNSSRRPIVFEWTMHAVSSVYPDKLWTDTGLLRPGESALWLMPAESLSLSVSYGDRQDFISINCAEDK